ncbi:hypothetical protein ACHAWT_008005 [Skeletonema menzelii]
MNRVLQNQKRKGCCIIFLHQRAESAGRVALFGRRHYYASTSSALQNNNGEHELQWGNRGQQPGKQTIDKISSSNNRSNETPLQQKRHQQHAPYTKPKSQQFQAPFSVFISCLPGLEPLLLKEVEYLHSHWLSNDCEVSKRSEGKPHILRGGVKLTVPSLHHLYILHLYIGTASHIYIRLNDDHFEGLPPLFRARGFPELQRKVKDLIISQRWDEWLTTSGHCGNENSLVNVQVHVTTSKSKLMHTKAIEERLKQTIGEIIPNMSDAATAKTVRLMTRIDRDVVQLSLDTSLTPLHRRGYRLKPHRAPLREDLAYALLMAGGLLPCWDLRQQFSKNSDDSFAADLPSPSSRGTNHRILFDPFCGSGTIAIEGASLQLGLPPGRFHPAPLDGTCFFNPVLWEEMKSKAMSAGSSARQYEPVCVAAGDIDPKALDAAKANAKRAGVDNCIDFVKGSFVSHPLLNQQSKDGKKSNVMDDAAQQSLLVVANPPYGKRLSQSETNNTIYRKLANVLLSSSSSSRRSIDCAVIGKDVRVMREAGIPSLDVAFSTKHGGLSVAAMAGSLPTPNRP